MANRNHANRQDLVRRGQRLEYFTVAYNSVEGLISIIAGIVAGSVFTGWLRPGQRYRSGVRGGAAVAAASRLERSPV